MSNFVNELTPPKVCSQQGQCVQQCQRIMKDTLPHKTKFQEPLPPPQKKKSGGGIGHHWAFLLAISVVDSDVRRKQIKVC